MDVKTTLEGYIKTKMKLSMMETIGKSQEEIAKVGKDIEIIDKLIEQLPPEQGFVLDRHYRQGKSYKEISRMIGYCKMTICRRAMAGISALNDVVSKGC